MAGNAHTTSARLSATLAGALACTLAAATALGATLMGKYEEFATGSCSGATLCTLQFSAVPAGKVLFTTGISCRVAGFGAELQALALGAARNSFLMPQSMISGGGIWQSNDRIDKFYSAGLRPTVTAAFTTTTNIIVQCTLSGDLKP
jgi:hypothetical protein